MVEKLVIEGYHLVAPHRLASQIGGAAGTRPHARAVISERVKLITEPPDSESETSGRAQSWWFALASVAGRQIHRLSGFGIGRSSCQDDAVAL